MASLHPLHKWFTGLCALGAACLLLGCEADVRDECGGFGDQVSCLSIQSITPTDGSGNSSNVDAFQSVCSPGTVDPVTGEPTGDAQTEALTDHNATIVFANTTFPTAQNSLPVTIMNYSVSYSLNFCPANALCPPLTGFSVSPGQTLQVPAGGVVSADFPLVPLSVKSEFAASAQPTNGGIFPPPSYTATYVFTAQTDFFSSDIRIEGFTQFTIGNFNNCM